MGGILVMIRRLQFTRFAVLLAFSVAGSLRTGTLQAAKVNPNNGNFEVSYRDFFLPTAGLNIEVTRTYNSRSNYVRGYFGMGWSSEMEGYVSFDKKDVVYFEGGGGNVIRFIPAKGKTNLWTNNVFGQQSIRRLKEGYILKTPAAKDIVFDNAGRLVKITDRNKNFYELVYNKANRPELIRDNLNNQIKIGWGTAGNFPRINLLEKGDLKARYKYSASGDLLNASGIDAVAYDYNYDDEHNLLKVKYMDGSTREIGYNKARDWVTSFKDRNGMLTKYDYRSDNLDPENKFGTVVSTASADKKTNASARYWYEFRRRADGSRYNYRAVSLIRGLASETIFTECCSTPMVISQWQAAEPKKGESSDTWMTARSTDAKRSTFFEYYPDGLLKKKTAPDGIVTLLSYDPKTEKVASVERAGRKLAYHYDPRGNLAWAFDSADNRRLDLTYDSLGRITILKEARNGPKKELRTVYFRYNPQGKPIEIKEKSAAAQGSIFISYNKEGEVLGITSAGGRAIASETDMALAQRVAITFQNLLEIVQPAGVSLSPEG